MSEEEERQYEKCNFTFPVLIKWKIEDIPLIDDDEDMITKAYNVPGFPWFTYAITFGTKLETYHIGFWRIGLHEDHFEWESNLYLTINNGEPKEIFQKFKEDELLLHEGTIEELINSKTCSSVPITLQIKGTVTVHEILIPRNYYVSIPSSSEFTAINEPKDFIIEVKNQEIQVHKKVLQKHSPVFSAMFENGWKEASEGRVVIPEFPFEVVETIIKLCYGGWIDGNTKNPELVLLYHFADKYDMDEIKYAIKEIIFLTPNNICEYANLFHTENCHIFVNHCINRLIVYFQFSYPVKDLETLYNVLKLQFFYQASVAKAMKKEFNPDYHKNLNDERGEALPLL